jgi:hypothetical protein
MTIDEAHITQGHGGAGLHRDDMCTVKGKDELKTLRKKFPRL